MGRLNIEVVENATKTVNIMPETPLEKVVADCMKDYLEMRKAEEQGLLVKLPVAIGGSVYHALDNHIHEYKVIGLVYDICNKKWIYEVAHQVGFDWIKTVCRFDYIGKTVFLTREEAEQALKQKGE